MQYFYALHNGVFESANPTIYEFPYWIIEGDMYRKTAFRIHVVNNM
jgi:hypothetical protein